MKRLKVIGGHHDGQYVSMEDYEKITRLPERRSTSAAMMGSFQESPTIEDSVRLHVYTVHKMSLAKGDSVEVLLPEGGGGIPAALRLLVEKHGEYSASASARRMLARRVRELEEQIALLLGSRGDRR